MASVTLASATTEPAATVSTTAPPPVENTNLIDVINSKLGTLPNHHLRDACQEVLCGAFSYHKVCQNINGKLTVQPPLIVSAGPTVKISQPNWKSIPADFYLAHAKYKNCGSIQQSQTFQHVITLTEGIQITKTKALMTGSSVSVQIKADFKVSDAFSFGQSTQYTVNTQSTITDANAESYTSQKQESVSNPVLVPSMTEVQMQRSFIQYHVPVPFSGTITVDGQVAPNLDSIALISNVVPASSDRTFAFSGTITDSSLVDDNTTTTERKLTPAYCAGTTGQFIVQH